MNERFIYNLIFKEKEIFDFYKGQYVYFITDFVKTKIGRSKDPIKRSKEIITISNKFCFPILICKSKLNLEKLLHNKLHKFRCNIHGFKTEWFNFNPYELVIKERNFLLQNCDIVIVFDYNSKKYIPLKDFII